MIPVFKEKHITVYAGLVFPKYCLYVDHVNKVLTALIESGQMSHFFTRNVSLVNLEMGKRQGQSIKPSEAPQPLELVTVLSSLMFLGGMLLISAVVFVLEVFTWSKDENNNRKQSTVTFTQVQPLGNYQ